MKLSMPLLVCVFCSTASAQSEWKKHVVYKGNTVVFTAVAADFTGDGQPDVITDTGRKTRLLVAPNWKEVVIDEHPKFTHNTHAEFWDVDGDGDQDFIAARYDNPGLIVWFEQPANGITDRWNKRLISDQVFGIHGVIKGDIDGDGKFDLLATAAQPKGKYPESLVWFSVPKQSLKADQWNVNAFANKDAPGLSHYVGIGDMNGDGRIDAATGAKGGPSDPSGKGEWFAWWEAPGNPRDVWTKRSLPGPQPGATNIHPADVNGDGKQDFIASRGHGRGVIWFEAPNWKVHDIHASLKEPHCLVVVDMDEDGDIDAATCAFGDKTAAWFENDGKGNFKTHIIGTGQEAYDIRAVDMDLDEDLDLLIAGRRSNNVVWYENPMR
ncbi:MAG: FG-GAP repeat domain-containing protein [Planctomycetaceae bacterium]